MNFDNAIFLKIDSYKPKGGLAQAAKLFIAFCDINHSSTKDHCFRVALLAESAAKILKKDVKAAFFAGLLHDIGKMMLPSDLFDGHNITAEEYAQVKTHAQNSFKALKKFHLFTALCAGLHHNLYKSGYGILVSDFPPEWSVATVKKVLDISMIVSISDFVDAFTSRKTEIKDGSDQNSTDLKTMLCEKYPHDVNIVEAVLQSKENEQKIDNSYQGDGI